MQTAAVTAPLPATPYQEPTHRFGRALDDRLPASGMRPGPAGTGELTTASVTPATDDDGFSFNDLLDVVNPLQHLPVVSTLYREFTGDEIRPESRVLGGGLFGGIIGAAGSLLDVALEAATGDTAGGHVMTALFGEDEAETMPAEQNVEVAARQASETPPPAAPAASIAAATAPPKQIPRSVSDQPSHASSPPPAVPALSPSAFDALLESFGTPPDSDKAPTQPGPGLAYAPQRTTQGLLLNEAL